MRLIYSTDFWVYPRNRLTIRVASGDMHGLCRTETSAADYFLPCFNRSGRFYFTGNRKWEVFVLQMVFDRLKQPSTDCSVDIGTFTRRRKR